MSNLNRLMASTLRMVETGNGLAEIRRERDRQDRQWGEQNHPLVLSDGFRRDYAHMAARWQGINVFRAAEDKVAWDGILLEEVYEALSEEDPVKREAELIQVAAVALNAWEASRRARLKLAEEVYRREYQAYPVRYVAGIDGATLAKSRFDETSEYERLRKASAVNWGSVGRPVPDEEV